MCTLGQHLSSKSTPIDASKLSTLKDNFEQNAYPTDATIHKLAEQLGLSVSRVRNWFTCHRQKVKLGRHSESSSIGEDVCNCSQNNSIIISTIVLYHWTGPLSYWLGIQWYISRKPLTNGLTKGLMPFLQYSEVYTCTCTCIYMLHKAYIRYDKTTSQSLATTKL